MSYRSFVPIKEGNTVIFYLNTGGFPLISDVWNQMWSHAKELQPSASDKMNSILENKEKIPEREIPIAPYSYLYNKSISNVEKLERIQNYVDKLQYNHTGLQFYEIRKDRPLMGLADLSKKIIEDSLPIKCLEAVILSIYLINEISHLNQTSGIEKFTIGFKTSSKGNIHRHVVLGVYCHSTGLFGALGLSRRSDLGPKELKYKTLNDLIQDYINSYSRYLHKVKRIKIGMPIPNSNRSFESIPWNGCTINLNSSDSSECTKLLDKHSRTIRHHNSTTNNTNSPGLKNMTNTTLNLSIKRNKSKTYLNNHLEEVEKKSQIRSKSLEQKKKLILDDQDDDYFSDEENFKINEANYLPRTAPVLNQSLIDSRFNSESITTLSLLSEFKKNSNKSSNFDSYSSNLAKRKSSSLRV